MVMREFTNNAAHGAALCGKVDAFSTGVTRAALKLAGSLLSISDAARPGVAGSRSNPRLAPKALPINEDEIKPRRLAPEAVASGDEISPRRAVEAR